MTSSGSRTERPPAQEPQRRDRTTHGRRQEDASETISSPFYAFFLLPFHFQAVMCPPPSPTPSSSVGSLLLRFFFFKSLLTIYGGEQAAIAQVPRKTERRSRIPSFFPSAPRYGTSYRGGSAISCCVYRLSKFVRVEWAQKKIGCGYVCGPGAWVLPWTRKPTCSMPPSSRTTRKRYRSYLDASGLNLVCSHWRLLPPCRI